MSKGRWTLIAVAAAILFVAVVRLRVADIPLERDEGEYAYAGRLILEGVPPYRVAYNMKFPGTYYAYAVILALFGKTAWGIHAGLIVVNAATIAMLFFIGRRLSGQVAGAAAAVSFALLSVDRWVLGIFAHATHFVVFAVVAGLLALLRALDDGRAWRFFASGVLFGVAVLMKQHAVFFVPLGAALLVWPTVDVRGLASFAGGVALPVVGVLALLAAQGVFGTFWFWTFQYAREYVSFVPMAQAFSNLAGGFGYISTSSLAFWIVGAIGLAALWLRKWDPRRRFVFTGLLVASFVAIVPGLFFRSHYFILMLPALALLIGVAVSSAPWVLMRWMEPGRAQVVALLLVAVPVGVFVIKERAPLFTMGTRELSRTIFGSNPFIEAVEIAKYIRERTEPGERIAIVGSEPEIYFYAGRSGATGYIYTYALMEPQPFAARMQDEMIREIEAAHPRYLVFPWITQSWLPQPGSDQRIVTWARRYVRECYEAVGVAEIVSEDETRVAWDDEARHYRASSENLIYTFKRKGDEPCVAPR